MSGTNILDGRMEVEGVGQNSDGSDVLQAGREGNASGDIVKC